MLIVEPYKEGLLLHQLRYPAEIRNIAELKLSKKMSINKNELAMALMLISKLSRKFKPEEYHDTYEEKLTALIKQKMRGRKIQKPKVNLPKPTKVYDLMSKLKASIKKSPKSKLPRTRTSKSGKVVPIRKKG